MKARPGALSLMAALTATLTATPREARPQACCNATSAGEVGLVGRCQQAVIGAQVSYTHGTSRYDQRGRASTLAAYDSEDMVWTLAAGVHLLPRLQLYAALPVRAQHRASPGAGDTLGFGVGDAEIGAGVLLLDDEMVGIGAAPSTWSPFVELMLSAHLPTGRAASQSADVMQADVTGDGSWGAALGARVAKSITPEHTLRLRGELRSSAPHPSAVGVFDPGDQASMAAGWSYMPSLFWTFGAQASWSWRTPSRLDGEPVAYSAQRKTSLGVSVSHALDFPAWELLASLSLDALWDGAGANIARTGPSLTLGIRRNFMSW